MFWRHIPWCTEGLTGEGNFSAIVDRGEPEVEDFNEMDIVIFDGKHDIIGFKVAMDDAHGMGFRECAKDLISDMHDELSGDFGGRDGGEFGTADEFHDDIGDGAVFDARVDEFNDIRVRDASDALRLSFEAREDLRIV